MRHVFRRPENIASVAELIEAKKEQDSFLKNVMKRFMSGKKDSRNGTQPMSPSAASPERHSASGLDHGMLGSFNMTGGSNHQGPMSSFSRHNQNQDGGNNMRNGKAKKNSSKRVSRENPSVVTNIKISRGFTDRKNLTLTNDQLQG